MKHAPPAPPELGMSNGLSHALFLPRGSPRWASWCSTGRVPPRRATSTSPADAATTGWPRWPSTRAATAARRATSAPAPWTTCWPWRTCSARTSRGWPCVDRAWAGSSPSMRPRATPPSCAVVAICAAPEDLLRRALRRDGPERFRCDVAATEAWLATLDIYDAAAGLGPDTALLLLHARGDEQMPPAVSEQLFEAAHEPKRLLAAARRPPPLAPARHGAPGGVAQVRARSGAPCAR